MALEVIGFVLILLVREYSHYLQDTRRDELIDRLTDKIKARDFTEYKEMTTPIPTYAPVSNDDDDLYDKEIEDNKM